MPESVNAPAEPTTTLCCVMAQAVKVQSQSLDLDVLPSVGQSGMLAFPIPTACTLNVIACTPMTPVLWQVS